MPTPIFFSNVIFFPHISNVLKRPHLLKLWASIYEPLSARLWYSRHRILIKQSQTIQIFQLHVFVRKFILFMHIPWFWLVIKANNIMYTIFSDWSFVIDSQSSCRIELRSKYTFQYMIIMNILNWWSEMAQKLFHSIFKEISLYCAVLFKFQLKINLNYVYSLWNHQYFWYCLLVGWNIC